MIHIEVEVEIGATRSDIWSHLAKFEDHVEWMHDAERIAFASDQRSGLGTRFDVHTRVGPLTTVDRMTVTEWKNEHRIGVDHTGLVKGSGYFTIEPVGERTTFQWSEDLTFPLWFGGRLGEIIAKPLLTRVWRRNLRTLKARVERMSGPRVDADKLDRDQLLLAHLARHGYPVPRVCRRDRDGVTVVDRVDGPTMLSDLTSKPWRLHRHAMTLVSLHEKLRTIPVPEDLGRLGPGNSILHLDLHPANVIISDTEPVVIHWSNAKVGSGDLDVALTWVIMSTGTITGNRAARAIGSAFRTTFVRVFERAAGQQRILANATAAAELRLLHPNLSDIERDEVFRLARTLQNRPTPTRTDDA